MPESLLYTANTIKWTNPPPSLDSALDSCLFPTLVFLLPVDRQKQNTPVSSVAADVSCLFSSSELRTRGPPVGTWSNEDKARRYAAGCPGLDLKSGPLHSGGSVTHPIMNVAELLVDNNWVDKSSAGQLTPALCSRRISGNPETRRFRS